MSAPTGLDDALLATLCRQAGLSTRWQDAFGRQHDVAPDDLRVILAALDLDVSSDAQARERIAALEAEAAAPPPMLTGEAGHTLRVPVPPGR